MDWGGATTRSSYGCATPMAAPPGTARRPADPRLDGSHCPAESRAQIRAQFWFLTGASTSLPTWPGDRGDGYRARQDELLDGLGETFVLV